ncbi:hypothetical protein QUH73_08980 [Labilibaculum sp. K2S]|uniref:hypothetical protein n=1 Tax=Labilibaculum sp. K2S TaxID=3056386 RepID=UPI0025A4AFEC|nr:hypothetical protein [Labilibaculum sp. K2S]MDM8159946.1 hypothetical protein [Labilibaculum sp. K2S]
MGYCLEKNILNIELKRKIGRKEMKECWERINNDSYSPITLRIFEDASLAEFDFKITEIDQICRILEHQIDGSREIRHAMLRVNPLPTAYGIMRERTNNNPRYFPKVFSTRKMAMEWLLEK